MGTKAVASAVSAIVACLLVVPGGLAAKEARGAAVVVAQTNAKPVEGELIAVKPDGLVVLSPAGADPISVNAADIVSVRIVRRSVAGKGALWGGLGGAFAGGLLGGLSGGLDEFTSGQAAVMLGVVFGGIGCLGGLGVGTLLSVDTTIPFAGEPEALARGRLANLLRFSREYRLGGRRMRLKIGPASAPTPPPAVRPPEAAGAAPPPARRARRFRVRLPYNTWALRPSHHYDDSNRATTTFRFPGNTTEPGPFPIEITRRSDYLNDSGLDSVSLGYELSDRLAVEAEVVLGQWRAAGSQFATLRFTSALDGITYEADWSFAATARFSAALIGLTYRPAAPTEFRRHIVEAGLAAGPAWARLRAYEWSPGQIDLPSGKLTLAAGAHAAYDFYVTPAWSVGVAVGYRLFRAALPEFSATTVLTFHETVGPEEYPSLFLERTIEIPTVPLTIDASGFYIGLRMGLRF
ncbi:MAG TPA: hypothetical protein VLJ16_06625 [Acidobacteriota bacterium]|nr:hypothetical protein [Acidobacteriota bacterium]